MLHVKVEHYMYQRSTQENMATSSLEEILSSFTTATKAATSGLPQVESLLAPEHGITLLDAKNEIFLSYLQALALRNLTVLRGIKHGDSAKNAQALSEKLTRKLVEHRVYLERGVRPLEQKIKYQVDKVVKTAEDEERAAQQKASMPAAVKKGKSKASTAGSDDEDDSEDDESDDDAATGVDMDELAYRPNPAAFNQAKVETDNAARNAKSSADGIYRPPRVSATAMPTTESREKRERPGRSHTVDEYITSELSTAPAAQPSVGSTITDRGRGSKNAKDLQKEAERREYEETNLVRLPKESKKELAKRQNRSRAGYGGEEWKGLGESLDRIGDLTKKKGGRDSALDKSRKRRATEDGPRGDGIGGAFDVKKQRMDKKARR